MRSEGSAMLWKGRRQSDNIEDVRGQGGEGGIPGGFGRNSGGPVRIPIGRSSGGLSISTIIIIVVLYFALRACGIDPLQMLSEDRGGQPDGGGTVTQDVSSPGSDEMKQFVATVLAETEDVWNGIFQAQGLKYEEPTLTLFSGSIQSACGYASAASGPFYCPGDRKVYLDTDFFDQLANQFGASGDFAEAYVVAHEVGHHVQNLTGILPKFNQMRQQMSEVEANQMSIRVELQADCFAGVWGHYTEQKGILEQGDLEEALNAAQQIGDDTLQKKMQGYVVPESFNHGTSKQRVTWFNKGFQSGKLSDCDTFNNPV
jgi:predicted metalloprotease